MTAGVLPIRTTWLRPMRDGAIVACFVLAAGLGLGLLHTGVDAHAYWAADPLNPYRDGMRDGEFDAYWYAPAFTQFLGPLHLLPWPWFIALWTLLLTAAFVWQAGLWTGIAILLVPVFAELTVANIHFLLGAAILGGFRWPWLWAFPLLTKVTPGVGLLWFAVRREWRNLAIALGATAGIALVSFAIAPSLWLRWVQVTLEASAGPDFVFIVPVPLWLRLAVAVPLVVWGARTDRAWTVPVAAMLALPVLRVNGLAMLVAVIPLAPRIFGPSPASRWLAGEATTPRAIARLAGLARLPGRA